MKSDKEIYADVYIAALKSFLKVSHLKGGTNCDMPTARKSAEFTVQHFRETVDKFPECYDPSLKPSLPSVLDTNPEAGKF